MIVTEEGRKEVVNQILRPSARIVADRALGSGTVVYSKDGKTYLLTNYHVISENIDYKKVWDNIIKRDIKKDFVSPVEVQMGRLDDNGFYLTSTSIMADIVAYNREKDMALLELRDKVDYPSVKLYPRDKANEVPLLVNLCACGCALGEKPVVTFGNLNGLQIEIDNEDYWISTAPSIFGNSGGGVFTNYSGKEWEFLGIPSRIPVIMIGFGGDAITHLGYFIPIYRIYEWLDEVCYQFIYNGDYTPEKCKELRAEKKERELGVYRRIKDTE